MFPHSKKGYLGNQNLKRVGEIVHFTQENVAELLKCANDPVYFIKNYVKIISLDEGFIKFKLRPYQEEMIQKMHTNRFVIGMLPRQAGKTTTVAAYFLWCILFNSEMSIAILANKDTLAREILKKVKKAYEALPKWIQQSVTVWNKGSIELENGSRIMASSTTAESIRGYSFNLVLLDEFARIPKTVQDEFFSSVYPTITSGKTTKTIIISTPKGMDLFYKIWMDAQKDPPRNSFKTMRYYWNQVPGRDEKWKQETIANIGEHRFKSEFDCEFIGSNDTLIDASAISMISFSEPLRIENTSFRIFEEPRPDRQYYITVDSAHGKGKDFSVCNVFDITEIPFRQVAVFQDNMIPVPLFPWTISSIGKMYNTAPVLVEINDIGYQVTEILANECFYENILNIKFAGRSGQVISQGGRGLALGLRMNDQVKKIACSALKPMVENGKIIIPDFETVSELSTFVSNGTSYSAEDGYNDDLVSTLLMLAWSTLQEYFKEISGSDVKKMYDQNLKNMKEQYTPGFFMSDVDGDVYLNYSALQIITDYDLLK